MTGTDIRWEVSVFLSRLKDRIHYVVRAPFVYRNWWEMYLVNSRSSATVLQLRNGTKYCCRPRTTDLAVVNEATMRNDYLGPGFFELPPDATVVDVGANIGDFTIAIARRCPVGRVFAIEPVAENRVCMQQNLRLNAVDNVTVIGCALGAHDGEIDIHVAGSRSSAYWGNRPVERVPLLTLASVMREHDIGTIDLLKMDCEGAEWDIMPASEGILPRIRQICLEYHNGKLTAEWLQDWLSQRGFVVRRTVGEWTGHMWAWRRSNSRGSEPPAMQSF